MDSHPVVATLKRLLANGPLTALPRHPADLEALLALAALRFEPERSYSEAEVNDILEEWLATFCAPCGIDHVTVRRCLVDARRLWRDAAGSAYRIDAPRRAAMVDASEVEPAALLHEIRRTRDERKRRSGDAAAAGDAPRA